MLCAVVSMQFSCVETVLRGLYLYLTDMGKMAGGELTSRILDKASFWQPSAVLCRGNCALWRGNQSFNTAHWTTRRKSQKSDSLFSAWEYPNFSPAWSWVTLAMLQLPCRNSYTVQHPSAASSSTMAAFSIQISPQRLTCPMSSWAVLQSNVCNLHCL